MASSLDKIKFNKAGKGAMLRTPLTKALLTKHAESVKKRADDYSESGVADFAVVSDVHKVSAHAHVLANDAASIESNLKHDSLVRALAKEPGVTMHV